MKYFLGPGKKIEAGLGCAALAIAGLVGLGSMARAQVGSIVELVQDPNPLLGRPAGGASQGYLGVELGDLDTEKAQALKLKEVRGAVITSIDHDAPAGKVGLKINDVVVQMNGQAVEGAEQLRRMLREIPVGRKVTLGISRDGSLSSLTVELADRRKIEADAWHWVNDGGALFTRAPGMGILSGGDGGIDLPSGLPSPFSGSTLNVGALVEPLTTQMAQYMGVPSGVMVRQVAKRSEAAAAGLKAFDVILKVGAEPIANTAAWDRALRSNEGKPVQVTVLRDRKQQTLTLQVDSKRHSELEWDQVFPGGGGPEMAELDARCGLGLGPEFDRLFGSGSQMAEQLSRHAEQLKDRMLDADGMDKLSGQILDTLNSKLAEERMRQALKQAGQWSEAMRDKGLSLDPKLLEEMKRGMEQFQKNFKPEDLKIDPKKMDELRKQMEDPTKRPSEWN